MEAEKRRRDVAILLFDQVEILDFAGPYEAFLSGSRRGQDFRVYTVTEKAGTVQALGQLSITPTYTFDNCPQPDILIIPGGPGTRQQMHNQAVTGWIETCAERAELVLSVCTGALILAKTSLLKGLRLTTNRLAVEELRQAAPSSAVITEEARYIDNGHIILSAGVSAGIDMSLYVIGKCLGQARALEAAALMEYDWKPAPLQEKGSL